MTFWEFANHNAFGVFLLLLVGIVCFSPPFIVIEVEKEEEGDDDDDAE